MVVPRLTMLLVSTVLLASPALAEEPPTRPEAKATGPTVRTREGRTIAGPEGNPFAMPTDAAVGLRGDLYVLDGTNSRVVVFDPSAQLVRQFGKTGGGVGEFRLPVGIAVGPDGKVYVADSGNHRVSIHEADGEPLGTIRLPARAGDEALPDPTDMVLDPDGTRMYVSDNDRHRLFVYGMPAGELAAEWGKLGSGRSQLRYPFLLDMTDAGYLLVVESINTRVQVFNRRGMHVTFLGEWGARPGQLFRPKGVAALGPRIFVSDGYLGRVMEFDLLGKYLGVLGDAAGKPITFTTPTGMAVDKKRRRLYVVELKANRVRWIEPE